MPPIGKAPLNKGGRLEGKVVNFDGTTFTIEVSGKGHEDHGKTVTLPRTMWRGPGAVCGGEGYEGYGKDDPRSAPRAGDVVFYDSDVMKAAKEDKKAAAAK
jgi:hypothetical protein